MPIPFRPTLHLDLSGPGGNIFAVVGNARRLLTQLDRATKEDAWGIATRELSQRIPTADSYDAALAVVREYVDLIDTSEED